MNVKNNEKWKNRCSEAFEEISRIFPRKMPQWKKLSKSPKKIPNLFISTLFLSSWLRVLKTFQKGIIRITGGCFEGITALFLEVAQLRKHNFRLTKVPKFQIFKVFMQFLFIFLFSSLIRLSTRLLWRTNYFSYETNPKLSKICRTNL